VLAVDRAAGRRRPMKDDATSGIGEDKSHLFSVGERSGPRCVSAATRRRRGPIVASDRNTASTSTRTARGSCAARSDAASRRPRIRDAVSSLGPSRCSDDGPEGARHRRVVERQGVTYRSAPRAGRTALQRRVESAHTCRYSRSGNGHDRSRPPGFRRADQPCALASDADDPAVVASPTGTIGTVLRDACDQWWSRSSCSVRSLWPTLASSVRVD